MVKNYQKIMDDEYVNAVLKNIQMRVKLQNLKAEPMNEYDNGIEPRQTMEQTLNRTEFLNNTMAQRQKMDENLFKLFQDDEVSINIVYDNIAQSDEDVLFFNSNFNKLYKEISDIIDLDYLDANYFIAFYERYKQKYSDPKNIIVDENLKKLDEEQFNQEVENAKDYYGQNFGSSYQNPNNIDEVNESINDNMGNVEYEEEENVNNQTNNDVYIKEQIQQDKKIIDILSIKPTYKKYGDFIGSMCYHLLMQYEFFLSGENDILGEPLINKKESEKNLYKLFSKLKMLFKFRYDRKKKLKYVNEIQPYIEYEIVNFDVSKIKYRDLYISYDELKNQTWAQTDDQGIENFMEYIALAINKLMNIDYQNLNNQRAEQVQNKIEELRIQEEEAREKERIRKEKELQDIKDLQERIIDQLNRRNTKNEKKRLEEEQQRLELERIQLEEQMRQDRERKENDALGKIEDFSKILKAKNEKQKLKKQREEEEERIRLEQEEEEEFNATQNIKSNPHGFDNGDIITDDNYNYEVVDNYAKKILKNGKSETGKLEYTIIKGKLGWYKSGKAVNVSMVQPIYSSPQKAQKTDWPLETDFSIQGQTYRRFGDYLFEVDTSNNKVNEYPKYYIEFDDSLTKLTTNSTDYIEGHNNNKQEIQDYNATLGAGLKRNIGVSKILKSLGYEII